jgi:hypothetical protein
VRVSVLGNDTDGDADPLSVTAAGDPANGSVVVNSDGTITYTPDTGFVGTDSFTYTISDGRGGQDTATVTVTVAPTPEPDPNTVPNAVDDTARLTEGKDQIVIDVLGNDRIPSGSALTITITEEPKHGHVVINADGTITYTATGNGDSDQFTYRVCDEDGSCSSAVVSVDLPDGRSSGSADDDAAGPSSQTPTNPEGSPALAFTGAAVPLPAVAAVGIVMLGLGVGLVLAARRSGSAM